MLDGFAPKIICLEKCEQMCWLHRFLWELEFVPENNLMLHMEQHAFLTELLKNIKANFQKISSIFFMI